jgi:1-acyl-sn-glycerol-3-phosphate acyltransferase
MVTPALKQMFAERHIDVLPIDAGTQTFVDALSAGRTEPVQVLVGSPFSLAVNAVARDPGSGSRSYRICRKLTLDANPFLQHHCIGEQVVLPIACSAAWMANTCEQLYPGYRFFCSENHTVFKGIVFDATLAPHYILDVKEVNLTESGDLELAISIWSETSAGKPVYHYGAQVTLRQHIVPAPTYVDLDLRQDPACHHLAPYEDGTLFHGTSFQGIQHVLNLSQKKLTMVCTLPQLRGAARGQFPTQTCDVVALDVQYQSMLIWVRQFCQAASLPLHYQRYEVFRPLRTGDVFYVSMDIRNSTETKLVSNITAHDGHGRVYSRMHGAEVTISKQLSRHFRPARRSAAKAAVTFWRQRLGIENRIIETLYAGLYRRFVGRVALEDEHDFQALQGKPRLYLANHQVGIESVLFVFAVSALANSLVHVVVKTEHQQSWLRGLQDQIDAYPGMQPVDLMFYFNRNDPSDMFTHLNAIKSVIQKQCDSLLVHVDGTRALSCRQPTCRLSTVFIDLAIDLHIPIVPVTFVGGLPIESLQTRLEFPIGYTHQDYHIGRAIYPETLKSMQNHQRKALILERLNRLGGEPEVASPHTPDRTFEEHVQTWMTQSRASETQAVLYSVLEESPASAPEVDALLSGIHQGQLTVPNTPQGQWLGAFGKWLSDTSLKVETEG